MGAVCKQGKASSCCFNPPISALPYSHGELRLWEREDNCSKITVARHGTLIKMSSPGGAIKTRNIYFILFSKIGM